MTIVSAVIAGTFLGILGGIGYAAIRRTLARDAQDVQGPPHDDR